MKLTQAEQLAAIRARREEIDREILIRERRMRKSVDALFSPAPRPVGRFSALMANAGTIAAVADGALLGYRLFRQIRRFTK